MSGDPRSTGPGDRARPGLRSRRRYGDSGLVRSTNRGQECALRHAGVRLGIPSVIGAALLPRLVGWGWTRRLLLLGEIISGQDAFACGLVERVVEDAQLDDAIEEWLTMLLG